MPTISVVIATHERPHLLQRAIESAHGAAKNVEVLVVDDASSDKTESICRSLSGIRYIRLERHQRVAGARNVGMLNSTGDFITFLDDDDVRLAGSLDLQVAALVSAPEAGLIYGQALINDARGLERINGPGARHPGANDFYPRHCPQGDVFWPLLEQNFIPSGAAVFRRSCLLRVGLLDQSATRIDDWDMWIRIAAHFPVIAVAQPVMIWRKSSPASRQGTSDVAEIAALSTRQLKRKWLKLHRAANAPESVRRDVWRRFSRKIASQMASESIAALKDGHYASARRNVFMAIRLHPRATVRLVASTAALRQFRILARAASARAGILSDLRLLSKRGDN